jgi:NAD(P)-dependent dehydrogenase (short-subunit alcohol dehydrogenase family)
MTREDQRSVIVTGAAGGSGHSIAERLAGDGFDVLAVDLEPAADTPARRS